MIKFENKSCDILIKNKMPQDLKLFLDLVPNDKLQSCSVELTDEMIRSWSKPHRTLLRFQNLEELEEYLALAIKEDKMNLLSMSFLYTANQRLELDVLMGHLYLRNNPVLISIEKLSKSNLIGLGKLIEEVVIEFSKDQPQY
jgi:hypothetical protein